MTERDDDVTGFTARQRPAQDGPRAAAVLFAVGLCIVAANSALYFFGADSLSHPAASVLGLALLLPLYLDER